VAKPPPKGHASGQTTPPNPPPGHPILALGVVWSPPSWPTTLILANNHPKFFVLQTYLFFLFFKKI
jgi:hypothetical protein